MTKEKVKNTYRTHQIVIKKGHRMYTYFTDMTEKAKNMYNTTNFFIRQTYTGLKSEHALHPLQPIGKWWEYSYGYYKKKRVILSYVNNPRLKSKAWKSF